MKPRTILLSILVAGIVSTTGFPQGTSTRPSQRARPAPGSSRPAYMQQLEALEETQQVTKAVLKNGMTVLVHEFRTLPVAALLTYVRSGYLNEPDEVAGVSQVLQRLLFKATVTKDAGTIEKQLRALGGILETASGPEQTAYSTVVPSAQWKKAAEIQADVFLNSALEEKQLQTEVDAILWEAGRALETPDHFVREKLLELAFAKQRMGRSSYGTTEGLRNLNRTKLLEHYKATHRPERVILVVAGDVNTSEVLTEVVRLYSKAKKTTEKIDRSPAEVDQSGFRFRQLRGPIPAPIVAFGFHTAPVASDDYPALQITRALLGLGRGAILSRRLRDQNKLILRGETELLAHSDAGYLMATFEVEPDKIDRSQLAFLTELEILKRLPPEAPDLERALAQLEREFWLSGQTVQQRAANLAYFEALGGGWKNRSGYLARLKKIKPAEISAAARKYLKLENCSMVEYLPNGAEARNLTTEGAQRTFTDLVQVSTREELAKREKATAPALHIPEGADPFNYSEVRFTMQKASILRGPELFIREDHTAPLIQMGIFFPGGKLFEKKENSGVTALMLQSMLHGFKDTPADQFHQQLELYGAEIVPVVEDDYFGFHFTVLSKNIERAMDSLLQIIKSPRFDGGEVGQEQKLQLASLGRQKNSRRAYAFRLLAQGLFGEFPYALNPLGTEASVASLGQEALKAWHKTTIENRQPTVIIIGDTEGTNLARYFVRNFSGSRIQQTKIPEDFPKPVEKKLLLEENADRSASAVVIGFQAPPEGDPDSAALAVLEKYATGPGGRLFDELREKQALVHEVSLAYRPRLRGGSVVIYSATVPEKEEAAQKALEEEIRRFAETPVLYKEYRTAVNQAVAAYWINQQSRQRQIVTTMQNFLAGQELAVMNEYPARLQAVREEDLQEIAQRILKLERAVTVRLHGKSNR